MIDSILLLFHGQLFQILNESYCWLRIYVPYILETILAVTINSKLNTVNQFSIPNFQFS